MAKTHIQYADEVSNPLQVKDLGTGKKGTHCEKPDPEGTCKNCWAEVLNTRGKPDNNRFGTGLTYEQLEGAAIVLMRFAHEMGVDTKANSLRYGEFVHHVASEQMRRDGKVLDWNCLSEGSK